MTLPIDILLINVGSNSNEKNGVAPVYSDGTFEYWPIEETSPGRFSPRFKDLGIDCLHPDIRAHYDPRFEPAPTYGDIRDEKAFKALAAAVRDGHNALLLFVASLKYSGKPSLRPTWVSPGIGFYIIGFFIVDDIRFSLDDGVIAWHGHEHNAHYLRSNHDKDHVKVIVGGAKGSRLLKKPFPISERPDSQLLPSQWLKQNFRELRGGPIGAGPWFRRTLRNSATATPQSVLREIVQDEQQ